MRIRLEQTGTVLEVDDEDLEKVYMQSFFFDSLP